MNDYSDDAATRPPTDPAFERTRVMPPVPPPPGHYPPPPGNYPPPTGPGPMPPRRRRPGPALVVALIIAVLLSAGLAIGYGFWGADDRGADDGVALAPREDTLDPLPDGDGTQPEAGPGTGGTSGSALNEADIAAIAAKVAPGLVDINVTLAYSGTQTAGTGMVLDSSGLVLTSNHVIQGAGEIRATSVGTGQTLTATVLGYDRSNDIALLQLDGASGLPTVSLGDSSVAAVGDGIVAIGNAGGDGGEPTSVGGAVTALNQTIVAAGPGGLEQLQGLIEVGANVQSGQSGGPTVNASAEVIGVTTAASSGYTFEQAGGTAYAVPINQAFAIAKQIQQGASSGTVHVGPTAFLGVSVDSSADLAPGGGSGGGQAGNGARVAGVLAGTPAEAAGMQSGDLITSVGGQSVGSAAELTSVIGRHEPGDTVTVNWTDRNGQEHTAIVTLIVGPPA